MQNPIQKFRYLLSSIVFEKPDFLSENFKILANSNYHRFQCFFFAHFPTYHCLQKGVQDFFLFCLDFELFAKIKKPDFYTLVFYIFIHNSRSK